MVPEDLLTAEPALTLNDVSVLEAPSDDQAPSSERTSIKDSDQSRENGHVNPGHVHLETNEKEVDNMSETLTRSKQHLWLSTEPENYVPNHPIPRVSDHRNRDIILRSPGNITLDVNIRVGGKAPKSILNMTFSAGKCGRLIGLQALIAAKGSQDARLLDAALRNDTSLLRLVTDLCKVTFRLEEDGHVANLTIAPTKIDTSCVFPETEYGTWYYRNILRGNQEVYMVEVNIEL
ncbi:uncharacterized protein Z519_06328 [Cladophialophora bantiana CBS 173.52]|uniref:Uncharacterized protein n=1 Tax=Cladophialophora bantiana (strain ATCC 10958 / CBS 173.52 / CDC B-1940 / NIH 8579) TaxID=1442370 RepID=A0A0D2ERJ6_CLAB1|nr:uncharacterized protein Z519_06328 [Cladophialophora bantiana CBS 173.52]KIW92481.1 hypothetical protein Z519_06328 [Cladophialophora bantiana CBS 173.52]